jgi:hypothetical protein
MSIRALSITQPFATLITLGVKTIETRSYPTHHRGVIALHASKGWSRDDVLLCFQPGFRESLQAARVRTPEDVPRGVVLGIARLVDCGEIHVFGDGPKWRNRRGVWVPVSDYEARFGFYAAGRYAWVFQDVRRFVEPVPAKGALGLWTWVVPKAAQTVTPDASIAPGAVASPPGDEEVAPR